MTPEGVSAASGVAPHNGSRAEDQVARRAYRRFEERGRQHGRDLDDWLEAEREVMLGEHQ